METHPGQRGKDRFIPTMEPTTGVREEKEEGDKQHEGREYKESQGEGKIRKEEKKTRQKE